jgi:hypothetical protein
MRRLFAVLCAASLMASVSAGCSGSGPTPAETTRSSTQPETHRPTASTSTKPTGSPGPAGTTLFPLTVTRTGGIAGFQDKLVIAGDGLVTVSRGGQTPRRCRLKGPVLERLTTAAARVPWSEIKPASREPSFPDDMVTTVQSRAGGPVALEDPRVAPGREELIALLNDLTGAPGSGACPPV